MITWILDLSIILSKIIIQIQTSFLLSQTHQINFSVMAFILREKIQIIRSPLEAFSPLALQQEAMMELTFLILLITPNRRKIDAIRLLWNWTAHFNSVLEIENAVLQIKVIWRSPSTYIKLWGWKTTGQQLWSKIFQISMIWECSQKWLNLIIKVDLTSFIFLLTTKIIAMLATVSSTLFILFTFLTFSLTIMERNGLITNQTRFVNWNTGVYKESKIFESISRRQRSLRVKIENWSLKYMKIVN